MSELEDFLVGKSDDKKPYKLCDWQCAVQWIIILAVIGYIVVSFVINNP